MHELFKVALSLSLSGSILIVVAFVCCRLLRNRLSKRWQYYIWLVVVLRLLIPYAPEGSVIGRAFGERRPVSESRMEDRTPATDAGNPAMPDNASPLPERVPAVNETREPALPVLPPATAGGELTALLGYLWIPWLLVALILLIRKITLYQSFAKYIKAGKTEISDLDVLNLFGEICEQSGVKRPIELYTNGLIASPLLMGIRKPCVVLPALPAGEMELRYICLHELAHYRRGDIYYKWLLQIVLCLHWFNPLVHLMVREANRACEFSCDEAIIRSMDAAEKRLYGDVLLESLKTPGEYREGIAALTLNENAAFLKERLEAIMKFRGNKKWTVVAAVLLSACLFIGGYVLGAYSVEPQSMPQEEKSGLSPEGIIPKEGSGGTSQPDEYSIYIAYARWLMEDAHTVFEWYFDDAPFDALWIDFDAPTLELNGSHYRKVVRFRSMEELKAATESVFTREFCEANFYELIDIGKFMEIDGILYVGDQGGVGEGYTYPPKGYIVRSVTEDQVVLTAICEGFAPGSDNPSYTPLIDYSFELVLRRVGPQDPTSPGDSWRADSYYSYNADGYQGGLQPFEDLGMVVLNDRHEMVLAALTHSGILQHAWKTPEEIEPDGFVHLYYMLGNQPYSEFDWESTTQSFENQDGYLFIPANKLEPAIQKHFNVSAAHMRTSGYYMVEKDCYWFGGMGSVANVKITGVTEDGGIHSISYEAYSDIALMGTGVLRVRMSDDLNFIYLDYEYLSNEYIPAPLTEEQQALRETLVTVGPDMILEEKILAVLVKTGCGYASWQDAGELEAGNLLLLVEVLIQTGDLTLPEDVERDPLFKGPVLPAEETEHIVQEYFAVSGEYLRTYYRYDAERGVYALPNTLYDADCRLVESMQDGNTLTIRYEIYQPEVFQKLKKDYEGTVTVELLPDGGWQYLSCQAEWVG